MLRKTRPLFLLLMGLALVAGLAMTAASPENDLLTVGVAGEVPFDVEPAPRALLDEDVFEKEKAEEVETPEAAPRFDAGRVGFAVKVKDEVVPYRVFGVFVMPGETLDLEAVFTDGLGSAEIAAEAGRLEQTAPERWRWTAPSAKGLHPVRINDTAAGETITLNVFVKVPFDHRGTVLNGYRIGHYEAKPYKNNPVYQRPPGFVEVTPENRDVLVSPHFTLGQFLCKQESTFPKYLLVRERLLLKLEMILEAVNDDLGVPAPTLHVMSAFRTPHYNKSIGNRTVYSRHLYGGAADIFIDIDGDGKMDDLDGDRTISLDDARTMAAIIEDQADATWYQPFVGGLGLYGPAPHRGPFIHVDVRGQKARW